MRFEWDPAKDALNRGKHGIGFEEAKDVFAPGSHRLDLDDDAHSDGDVVRIISARRATARERRLYEDWIRSNL